MIFLKKYKLEIIIFLLALITRCVYLGISVEALGGDFRAAVEGSDYYVEISENILAGNGFSIEPGPPFTPNSFRTPIMPFFLAGAHEIFGGYFGVVILQIVIASLSSILGMVLVQHIFKKREISIVVGFFLALEPFTILFSTIFYSETVFTFIFFIAILYLFKYLEGRRLIHLLFSGAFMGFAMLTKPTVQFLPIILGGMLLYVWRSDVKRECVRVALFIGVCAIVVSPWVYRNYVVTGSPGLSPQTGVQLYTVLWPSVLSMKNGTTFQQEFAALVNGEVKGPNIATVKESAQYSKLAIPLLLQNPIPLALVSANNILGFFTHDGVYDVLRHLKIQPTNGFGGPALFFALKDPVTFFIKTISFIQTPFVSILIMRVFWFAVTVLFIYGAIRYVRRESKFSGVAAIIVVLYFMVTTLVVGLAVNARYRLPVNVFIVAFATYAALPLINKVRHKHEI